MIRYIVLVLALGIPAEAVKPEENASATSSTPTQPQISRIQQLKQQWELCRNQLDEKEERIAELELGWESVRDSNSRTRKRRQKDNIHSNILSLKDEYRQIQEQLNKIEKDQAALDPEQVERSYFRRGLVRPHLKRDVKIFNSIFQQDVLEVLIKHLPRGTIVNLLEAFFPLKRELILKTPWKEGIVRELYDLPRSPDLTPDEHHHFIDTMRRRDIEIAAHNISVRHGNCNKSKSKQQIAYEYWKEKDFSIHFQNKYEYYVKYIIIRWNDLDKSLEKLDIWGYPETMLLVLPPADAWRRLKNLRSLNLGHLLVTDYGPLEGCDYLEELDLGRSRANDFSPLKELKKLKALHLWEADCSDVSFCIDLVNLEELDLEETKVTEITPLLGHINLKKLNLKSTPLTGFSALSSLLSLEDLDLSYTSIDTLTHLERLTKLRRLIIERTKVRDLSPLKGHTLLQELNLECIRVTTLEPARKMGQLRKINMDGSAVTDLSPLEDCSQLEHVSFGHTAISRLLPLTKLPRLRGFKNLNTRTDWEKLPDESKEDALQRIAENDTVIDDLLKRGVRQ